MMIMVLIWILSILVHLIVITNILYKIRTIRAQEIIS